MKTTGYLAIVVCLAIFLTSCREKWFGVFINATGDTATVSLVRERGAREYARFTLRPGETNRAAIIDGFALVSLFPSGTSYKGVPYTEDPHNVYSAAREHTIFFLVTEKGVFPIPYRMRRTWKEHMEQIVPGGSMK